MEKIKIGIIGVGNISDSHITAYKNDPRAELYAFCDINGARLQEMGEKHGVTRLYENLDEMLVLPELDAVSVCVWNNAHAECAIKALRAGKNVLCEKPMALNAQLAEEMEKVAAETGKVLMIGFVRRFGQDCALLKEYIDNGTFGDIYYAKVNNLRRHGNPGGWFADKSRSGGGPLIDLGVHVIDLVCYLLGADVKPVSVYGATFRKLLNRPGVKDLPPYMSKDRTDHDDCTVEDLATALIRFDNGTVLSVETAFELNVPDAESYIKLFGTKGGASITHDLTISTELGGRLANTKLCSQSNFDFQPSFCREISHFLDCVQNGTPCRNPAKDGVKLMKILDAIYASAEAGHEVEIKWN